MGYALSKLAREVAAARSWETVETVLISRVRALTPLKRGVNERVWRSAPGPAGARAALLALLALRAIAHVARLSLAPRFSEVLANGAAPETVLTVLRVALCVTAAPCRETVETVLISRVRALTP